MRSLVSSVAALAVVAAFAANGAAAQDASDQQQFHLAVPHVLALGASTGVAPATIIRTEDPARAKLERQVRINQGALIGTSVVTATGLSLWMVALARKCEGGFRQSADLACTQSGKRMRASGIALFGGGLTGMVISGTMLFVRKRQLKDLGSLVEHPKRRALSWDPVGSQFVF